MEKTQYDRTKMLIGTEEFQHLRGKKVICFGIGGVGGHCTEALARMGVGVIGIVDSDTVDLTNLNRQIIALHSTVGRRKTDVMEERIHDIDPDITVEKISFRLTEKNTDAFRIGGWDYVIDAIDDVSAKVALIEKSTELGVPVISCMGTGNKMNPSRLRLEDISKTHTCPLAKAVRKRLREKGITKGVTVVFSDEEPARKEHGNEKYPCPSSNSFVPASAGLLLASAVVSDLIQKN